MTERRTTLDPLITPPPTLSASLIYDYRHHRACTDRSVYLPPDSHPECATNHHHGTPITVHKDLAQSLELIAHNEVGLGALAESGLEGCNKILRNKN